MSAYVPWISAQQVAAALGPADAISVAEQALKAWSSGEIEVPHRVRWNPRDLRASVLAMFAASEALDLLSIKSLTVFPDNYRFKLPTIAGGITLFERATGRPLGRMDAEPITAIRTAATAAVAASCLLPQRPVRIALFGTGALCEPLLQCLSTVREPLEIALFGRNTARTVGRCETLREQLQLPIELGDLRRSLQRYDLIVTATTADHPLFAASDVAPDATIIALGNFEPTKSEIPAELVQSSALFVDARSFCAQEAGDLLIALQTPDQVAARVVEIGELLGDPGTLDLRQCRVFKSVGNAGQDLYAAAHVLHHVGAKSTGHSGCARPAADP